jgi:hypothetical protein
LDETSSRLVLLNPQKDVPSAEGRVWMGWAHFSVSLIKQVPALLGFGFTKIVQACAQKWEKMTVGGTTCSGKEALTKTQRQSIFNASTSDIVKKTVSTFRTYIYIYGDFYRIFVCVCGLYLKCP